MVAAGNALAGLPSVPPPPVVTPPAVPAAPPSTPPAPTVPPARSWVPPVPPPVAAPPAPTAPAAKAPPAPPAPAVKPPASPPAPTVKAPAPPASAPVRVPPAPSVPSVPSAPVAPQLPTTPSVPATVTSAVGTVTRAGSTTRPGSTGSLVGSVGRLSGTATPSVTRVPALSAPTSTTSSSPQRSRPPPSAPANWRQAPAPSGKAWRYPSCLRPSRSRPPQRCVGRRPRRPRRPCWPRSHGRQGLPPSCSPLSCREAGAPTTGPRVHQILEEPSCGRRRAIARPRSAATAARTRDVGRGVRRWRRDLLAPLCSFAVDDRSGRAAFGPMAPAHTGRGAVAARLASRAPWLVLRLPGEPRAERSGRSPRPAIGLARAGIGRHSVSQLSLGEAGR